ncbi:MAG: hypothetical protein L3J75_10720 [Methylococcaceae bacterium]|nr:hypothetical protein [Methylococcaceae bacterium]
MKNPVLRSSLLFVIFFIVSGISMAFGKTYILCSPFSGTAISKDGNPVSGVEIERKWVWAWNGKSGLDRTITDKHGKFNFPVVTSSSLTASLLPHEPDISQKITAKTSEGDLEIWYASKKTYELNSEMNGQPIKVLCRLDKKPSSEGLYWGTCIEDN